MKQSYYQKLKQENQLLLRDIRWLVKEPEKMTGIITLNRWKMKFEMEDIFMFSKRIIEEHNNIIVPINLALECLDQLERAQDDVWVKDTQIVIDSLKHIINEI